MINVEKGQKVTEEELKDDEKLGSHNRQQAFFDQLSNVIVKSIPFIYYPVIVVLTVVFLGLPILFLIRYMAIGEWKTLEHFWWQLAVYIVTFLGGILFEKKMKW